MLKLYFFISLVFITFFCFSQNRSKTYEIDSLLNIAYDFYLEDKDSIRHYLNKVKTLALKTDDINNLYEAYIVDSWDSSNYGDLNRMRSNIKTLDSLTKIYQTKFDSLPNKTDRIIELNYTKGQYYDEINDLNTSNYFFRKVLSNYKKLPDTIFSEDIFHLIKETHIYIADGYESAGKLEEAEAYYNMNLRLIKANVKDKAATYSTLMHLGDLFRSKKNYTKSNEFIFNCMPYYKQLITSGNNRVIVGYEKIIENFLGLKQLDSAKFYLKRLKNEFTENHSMYDHYHKVNSKVYEADHDYQNTLVALHQNLNFIKKKWGSKKNSEIAEAYTLIGEFHERTNDYEKALDNFNLALAQFSEESIRSTTNQVHKFKILKHKTKALNQLENYHISLENSKTAITILDSLKPSFKTRNDKLFLIENAFPLFENGIEAAFQLFIETKDSNYVDQAFFYSEKSKSTLLLESLLSSQATTFAHIPDELIEKEKQLKIKITYLEKQINKKLSNTLKDELFAIKRIHRNLIKNIEVNYKDYYDLKYNTQVSTLNSLQEWLNNDTVIVSYFYGNSSIYIISITKNSKHIEAIDINPNDEALLNNTYSLLSNPKSNVNKLQDNANKLYQKLLESALSNVRKKHIIIIPDGLLNYLPFGSLVDNSSNYLIENHSISYINSATVLTQLQRNKETNSNVLAFAPSYKNSTSSSLLPLPNNTDEVTQILSHFNGKTFINNTASLKNFNANTNNFGIIHLATHAVLNDKHPEYSYLAFTPEASEEHLLYINDLYNLELNSNMVTLSACETGLGDLKKGEGMLSLAHGFYFSGTSSISSTLWKVNDASSSQLMNDFYEQLSKGKTKDIALQNAKLNFLKTNKDNALSHPYYWSGYIISGNTDALISNSNWIYITLVGLGMIGLLFVLFRRKGTV